MTDLGSRDKILYPIVITEDNNRFRIRDNTLTTYNVILDPGVYYAYQEAGLPAAFTTDYPSFYSHVITRMNDAWGASGTWSVDFASQPYWTARGLKWTLSVTNDWDIVFNDSYYTIDPRLFGTNPGTNITGGVGGGGLPGIGFSPFCPSGLWMSPRHHVSNLGDRINVQKESGGDMRWRQTVRWRQVGIRSLAYQWIHANHVSIGRNNNAAFATEGPQPLIQYDHGNYFGDAWKAMSLGLDFLVIYYSSASNISTLAITTKKWEIGRLIPEFAEQLSSCLDLAYPRGEIYDIRFSFERLLKESAVARYGTSMMSNYYDED